MRKFKSEKAKGKAAGAEEQRHKGANHIRVDDTLRQWDSRGGGKEEKMVDFVDFY